MTVGSDQDFDSDSLQLGRDILQRSLDADEQNSGDFSEAVFGQTSELSSVLKSFDVESPETSILSLSDIDAIVTQVNLVISAVRKREALTPDIGTGSPVHEAFRLATFALLAVVNSSASAKQALQRENQELKAQILEYAPRDATPLLNYVRQEFSIPSTDPAQIAKELKRKRDSEKRHSASGELSSHGSPSSRASTELARAQAKIETLSQRVKSLEDSNHSRGLELEQLKSSTRTLSSTDFDVEPAERAKYNQAISELSSEVTRLTGELAEEATKKAQLLGLVQRQSSALAYAERQAAQRSPSRVHGDVPDIVSVLKAGLDQVYPRNELGGPAADILAARDSPAAKVAKLFGLVRARSETAIVKLAKSRDNLIVYLTNTLRFLDDIANSKDVQGWAIDGPLDDDFRPRLVAQLVRIDEYLARHGLSTESVPRGEALPGLADAVLALLKEQEPEPRDLRAALQVLVEVLEVSRKFAANLRKQNDLLIADRLEMKRELDRQEEAGEDVISQIADATAALKERVQTYKTKARQLDDQLRSVKQALHGANPDAAVEAALRVLGEGEPPVTEAARSLDLVSTMLQDSENAKEAALAANADLSKKLSQQQRQLQEAIEARAQAEQQLADRDRALADAKGSRQKSAAALADAKRIIETQREKIRRDQAERTAEVAEIERKYKAELAQKVAKLEEDLRKAEAKAVEEISAIQSQANKRVRSLQRKLEAQAQKAATVEESLESVSGELRQRLTDSSVTELSSKQEIQRLEAQVKQLRSELSSAEIDLKMLQVKVDGAEEKAKRDCAIVEGRAQAEKLTLQESHEQALAELQAAADAKLQTFVNTVAEPLAEFVPGEPNEESVVAGAAAARAALEQTRKSVADLSRAESELSTVRSVLGLPPEKALIPVVSQLTVKGDWEDWARRMHTLATGNFALTQSDAEVQAALEEALLSAHRQTAIARKLEVLRFEKKLLAKGKLAQRNAARKPSLPVLVTFAVAVRRLTKLAGSQSAPE